MSEGDAAEMPRYRCHKEVWALKIAAVIHHHDGTGVIQPEDTRYAPFPIDAEYIAKHRPIEGGYYVVYKDGYKSFSPSQAFEEGYTRI